MHWPRKGRTDVSFYQPRVGELNAHEQRHYRHVRETMKKNEAQVESSIVAATVLRQNYKALEQCAPHNYALPL